MSKLLECIEVIIYHQKKERSGSSPRRLPTLQLRSDRYPYNFGGRKSDRSWISDNFPKGAFIGKPMTPDNLAFHPGTSGKTASGGLGLVRWGPGPHPPSPTEKSFSDIPTLHTKNFRVITSRRGFSFLIANGRKRVFSSCVPNADHGKTLKFMGTTFFVDLNLTNICISVHLRTLTCN